MIRFLKDINLPNYPPILISAYSRPTHLYECLLSLEACAGSSNHEIYITIDAPHSQDVVEFNQQVIEVANGNWKFKSLQTIIPRENTGGEIIKQSALQLLRTNDTLIMFEEDNRFSPDFLSYMNWALMHYKNDSSVYSVSAWSPDDPLFDDSGAVFLYPGYCAWGVGLWAAKTNNLIISRAMQREYFSHKLASLRRTVLYFLKAPHLKRATLNFYLNGGEAGDRYIDLYVFMNKGFSVFPGVSRTKNVGHDGSGENCKVSGGHMTQRINSLAKVEYYRHNQEGYNFYRRVQAHYALKLSKNILLWFAWLALWPVVIAKFYFKKIKQFLGLS